LSKYPKPTKARSPKLAMEERIADVAATRMIGAPTSSSESALKERIAAEGDGGGDQTHAGRPR